MKDFENALIEVLKDLVEKVDTLTDAIYDIKVGEDVKTGLYEIKRSIDDIERKLWNSFNTKKEA